MHSRFLLLLFADAARTYQAAHTLAGSDEFVHLVATVELNGASSQIALYVDGQLADATAAPGLSRWAGTGLALGVSEGGLAGGVVG